MRGRCAFAPKAIELSLPSFPSPFVNPPKNRGKKRASGRAVRASGGNFFTGSRPPRDGRRLRVVDREIQAGIMGGSVRHGTNRWQNTSRFLSRTSWSQRKTRSDFSAERFFFEVRFLDQATRRPEVGDSRAFHDHRRRGSREPVVTLRCIAATLYSRTRRTSEKSVHDIREGLERFVRSE